MVPSSKDLWTVVPDDPSQLLVEIIVAGDRRQQAAGAADGHGNEEALLSEHWACAAELSKPVFFNTTFCE